MPTGEGPSGPSPVNLSLGAKRWAVRVHVGRGTGRCAALEVPGVAGVRVVAERGAGGDPRKRKRSLYPRTQMALWPDSVL
jgi:hypothetical protein